MEISVKKLKLEDLKIGMRVAIPQLNSIVGVPIILRESSMDYSTPLPTGEIVSIGEQGKENVVPKDSIYIFNGVDLDAYDGELGDL